jgi:hypothetical protein
VAFGHCQDEQRLHEVCFALGVLTENEVDVAQVRKAQQPIVTVILQTDIFDKQDPVPPWVLLFDSAAFNFEYAVVLYLYLITRVELSATPFFFLSVHLYVSFLQQRFGHTACGYTIRELQKLVQLNISTVDNYFFHRFLSFPPLIHRSWAGR